MSTTDATRINTNRPLTDLEGDGDGRDAASDPLATVHVDPLTSIYHYTDDVGDDTSAMTRAQAELLGYDECVTCWGESR